MLSPIATAAITTGMIAGAELLRDSRISTPGWWVGGVMFYGQIALGTMGSVAAAWWLHPVPSYRLLTALSWIILSPIVYFAALAVMGWLYVVILGVS